MNKFPLDKCREEFPDFLTVGVCYHWPSVPGVEWIEASSKHDITPSWKFETKTGMFVVLFISSDEEVANTGVKKYSVAVFNKHGKYISHVIYCDTNDLNTINNELCRLAEV